MKRVRKIFCLVLWAVLLVGVGLGYTAPKEKLPIKIGQITDFTNPTLAVIAVKERAAAQMAVREINAKGGLLGRDLELIVADNSSDTTLAISQARRLKEQGIIALVAGTSSTEAIAYAKWSKDEGQIPIIQAYGATDAINGHPWVFRCSFNDTVTAEVSLSVMQKLRKTKVGIVHTTLAYGIDLSGKLEKYAPKYGIKIVGKEALEFKSPDATVQSMKLRDAGAEGIISCDYSVGFATFVRALNMLGWRPPITGSWGQIDNALALFSPPTLMDGAIAQSVCDHSEPRIKKFLEDYAKFTKKEGDIDNAINLGYSSVLVLAHAIREAKTADDPLAIRDTLYKIKFKDLPLGRRDSILYFTPERNWLIPSEDFSFMVVKGGKLVPFKLE